MHEDAEVHASSFLERSQLAKLRLKAKSGGVWFKALQRIDRALVNLVIKVADSVRSPLLARCILAITGKLENALENKLNPAIMLVGLLIAHKLSALAQKWGNRSAEKWANDTNFASYWAVMKLNATLPG